MPAWGSPAASSNNGLLRAELESLARRKGSAFLAAQAGHTGDNAAMVAFAAWCDPDGCARGTGADLTFEPGLTLV